MPKSEIRHPLAEVFGFPITDQSSKANSARKNRLCPFNNKVPNCTKDKAKNPLGVCSIYQGSTPTITCPVRFREDWIITADAASFFFGENVRWSSLTEVRLPDGYDKSAGNIDVVLVAYDEHDKVIDFGALEVQAVYISGNVRDPFEHFMKNPNANQNMDWTDQPNYPRPDYLSSSRKRLAPQLLFKGGIINAWGKKSAVAMDKAFFATLPKLKTKPRQKADIGWFIYDLVLDPLSKRFQLTKVDEIFTEFSTSLKTLTTAKPGDIQKFIGVLQDKLDEKLESAPITKSVDSPF